MINSLNIKNFTEFTEANFDFSEGLNVIIGDNSTGKSHLLKLAYAIMYVWHEASIQQDKIPGDISSAGSESWWQRRLAEKLAEKLLTVFKPEVLGGLCRFGQTAQIEAQISNQAKTEALDYVINFNFSETSQTEVELLQKLTGFPNTKPLFLPAKEVLSWYPGFTRLYEERLLAFEETYYDLCKALSSPLLKHPETQFIQPLEKIIGGQVKLESDRFYIHFPTRGGKRGKQGISLIAEGLRKVALLSYLIANGSLKKGSTLFWDEPEANLNPRMIKKIADSLLQLVNNGVQIILATHNLFLMKELSLQVENSQGNLSAQFFSLAQEEEGVNRVESGKVLADLQTIVALDEELAFFDREQAAFYAAKGKK